MNCELILFLGGNLKVKLYQAEKLSDVDYVTVLYKDKKELINAYSNIICNYFNISKSSSEFLKILDDGNIEIHFNDMKGYPKKINPIYKEKKSKINPNSMFLFINKSLKDSNSFQLVSGVLCNFEYMFNSEFNIYRNNLYRLKEVLLDASIDNNSIAKCDAKDKFIEIVKDELSRDYDKRNKTTSLSCYIKLRLIYNYIVVCQERGLKQKPESDKASADNSSLTTFLDDFDNRDFTTMGDFAYQYACWEDDSKVHGKV